jgi:hypothetical protein
VRTGRHPRGRVRRAKQIPGFARSSQAAVTRLETKALWPGAVSDAFAVVVEFLKQPGRLLYVSWADCPCCDVVSARDTLQAALTGVPPRARADLRVIVEELDTRFLRRTLPDPLSPAGPWWHRRLRER